VGETFSQAGRFRGGQQRGRDGRREIKTYVAWTFRKANEIIYKSQGKKVKRLNRDANYRNLLEARGNGGDLEKRRRIKEERGLTHLKVEGCSTTAREEGGMASEKKG